MEVNLCNLSFGLGSVFCTPKAQVTKEKLDNLDFIKTILCCKKESEKMNPQNGKKYWKIV